ncbi:MAG: hypothetical protein E7466_02580 [Ruminococcaceae bacterium]|nr:hypothetical protein [Oscillospiraceae bacterium]
MSKQTFEEQLETQGVIIHTNLGDSMMPLLREGRDLMVIERRPEGPCKRYDAVLYKRPNGKYVMHRILQVRKDGYVLCGDNRCWREFGVPDSWILGILTAVIKDGKTIRVTDFRYRLYVHLWCDFFWIRVFLLRVKGFLRRRIFKGKGKK